MDYTCRHPSIDRDGYCTTCGISIENEYTKRLKSIEKSNMKIPETQIKLDLFSLPIPKNVIDQALIFISMLPNREFKLNQRKYTLFACIQMAYLYLDLPITPTQIGNICGFTESTEVTKGVAEYRRLSQQIIKVSQKSETPTISITSPLTLLYIYCLEYFSEYKEPSKTEAIKYFLEHAIKILQKDPTLNEKFPQKIAAGILRYLIQIHRLPLESEKLLSMYGKKVTTIASTAREIENIVRR